MTQNYDFSDISSMSHSEIKAKIAEIDHLQEEFSKRDFDAELGQAMVSGKSLDELESQHLEAERLSRRLRVAKASLESRLPEADREEVEAKLSDLAERHAELFSERSEYARQAVELIERLEEVAGRYSNCSGLMLTVATEMLSVGGSLEKRTGIGLSLPPIDPPKHPGLSAAKLQPLMTKLQHADRHYFGYADALVYKEGDHDATEAA